MEWFVEQDPEYAGTLNWAYQQLSKQLYTVEEIRQTTIEDWRQMDIPIGLGKQLKKRVREWDNRRRSVAYRQRDDTGMRHLAAAADFVES